MKVIKENSHSYLGSERVNGPGFLISGDQLQDRAKYQESCSVL